MRVGILCLMQESNTFIKTPTEYSHFEDDMVLEGDEIRVTLEDAHHEVAGFFQGLNEQGIEPVPIFAARAIPYGRILSSAYTKLYKRMFQLIDEAGKMDGYLVAPHGATVSSNYDDVDGHWLSELRARVGEKTPIIGTLDLHANLSEKMVTATDCLIGYRTNPHIDQRERGIEAAMIMGRTLREEIKPVQRAIFPPFIMNIEKQCTDEKPCSDLYNLADLLRKKDNILSISILQGFPYADVPEMGSSLIAVSNNNSKRADETLNELSNYLWKNRIKYDGTLLEIEEAMKILKQETSRTCLLDMGDNVGGGSPADSTLLAHALIKHQVKRSFVCLYDPESVKEASNYGLSKSIELNMGGKTDRRHGNPIKAKVRLRSIHTGVFEEKKPRHGGFTKFDQGKTAVVETENGMTIMLTSKRMAPYSLSQLYSCTLDPNDFEVLVAKGVNSPLAAYKEVCSRFIRVDTPGVTSSNLNNFEYLARRTPMYPFEKDFDWNYKN